MNRRDGTRRPDDCDPYYKKDITVDIGGRGLKFRVSQTLFSSYGIDAGTELLLRTLHREGGEFRKVLDLGCGYGPIGIALKGLNPGAALHMVDRDALAVRFAAENAPLNGVDDALVYPSIAFDDVEDRDFDLIAMNMPGKGGEAVIASWLRAAPLHLGRNGKVAVVVVSPLEPLVNEAVAGIPGAGVVLRRRRAGHTVLVFSVDDGQDPPHPLVRSFDRGDYDRSDVTFVHGQTSYSMRTVFGLPQFDSLSYRTMLLFSVLESLDPRPIGHSALVLNPGQGHVPVLLAKALTPGSIDMVDRDLLALRCSARNLILNDYESSRVSTGHGAITGGDRSRYDLIVGEMRDDEGPDVATMQLRQAVDRLAPGGQMVLAASSTTITRLIKVCRAERLGTVKERKRRRGSSVLVVGCPGASATHTTRALSFAPR